MSETPLAVRIRGGYVGVRYEKAYGGSPDD
jgi:hypothetical protein